MAQQQQDDATPLVHDLMVDRPFCDDMSCGCHEEPEYVDWLNGAWQDGLVGEIDRDLIYHGKAI